MKNVGKLYEKMVVFANEFASKVMAISDLFTVQESTATRKIIEDWIDGNL